VISLDAQLTGFINNMTLGFPALINPMILVTCAGIPLLVLLVAIRWWVGGRSRPERHVTVACGLSFIVGLAFNQLILQFVHRPRPYDAGVTHLLIGPSSDLSFPSAAQAILELSPLNPQELASLLYPLYVMAELQPITCLTAYGASGGQRDGQIILGLLGRSRAATGDVVKAGESAHAIELLQTARTAPLVTEALRAEIDSRLAELKAQR
jgi:hypothetical protein